MQLTEFGFLYFASSSSLTRSLKFRTMKIVFIAVGSRKRKPDKSLPNISKKDKPSPAVELTEPDQDTMSPPASPKRPSRARKQKRPPSDSEDDSTSFSRKNEREGVGHDDSDDTLDSVASSRSSRSRNVGATAIANQPAAKSTRSGRGKKIIETESDDDKSCSEKSEQTANADTEMVALSESPIPTSKRVKRTAPAKRGRKKQNTAPESSEEEDDRKKSQDPTPSLSTPIKRRTGRAATSSHSASVKTESSPAAVTRRRTTPAGSVEGSPAPISTRGRRRKVNADVKEFLKEAKKELETKTGRGKRGAKVKEEIIEEEEHETAVVKTEPKKRGGRNTKKPDVKQEADVSPQPLITVGRGKRKKVSFNHYYGSVIKISLVNGDHY